MNNLYQTWTIGGSGYAVLQDKQIVENRVLNKEPLIYNITDIAYWDGMQIKVVSENNWKSSLGTPIGVVVIPTGILPDGKARIVAVNTVDINGNPSTEYINVDWGDTTIDTPLINFDKLPRTNNKSTITPATFGYLPTDMDTGTPSITDPKAKYLETSTLIPSPYLNDTLNPEYSNALEGGNNALSDFNGMINTSTLVNLGDSYIAANMAWKYSDGASPTQWYLPSIGELGFLAVRRNAINNVLNKIGGVPIIPKYQHYLWSSTEEKAYSAYGLLSSNYVTGIGKDGDLPAYSYYVRPFAMI